MKRSRAFVVTLVLGFATTLSTCNSSNTPPPPPISVTISPAAAQSVDQGQMITYTATVLNDSAAKGATWKVSCSAANCGMLSAMTGATTVYTAPSPLAANVNVTVTATSAADPTKSAGDAVTVNTPPTISTNSLPGATGGVSYTAMVQESGGVAPLNWTLGPTGSLPAGLDLNGDGSISGTPMQGGLANFTVQVTDSGNPPLTASANLSITVTVLPMTITTASLPNATIDAVYNQSIQATGGIPPYTWSVSSGAFPAWATLRSDTGAISGIPGAAGTTNFTVEAADSEGTALTATKSLAITAATAASVNDSELQGQYAFLFNGFDDATGSQVAIAGTLAMDGAGKITGGVQDENGPNGAVLNAPVTGTYNIGADNRGALTIKAGAGSRTYALVLNSIQSGTAQKGRFVEFDDTTGTSGQRGSGVLRLQDATAFSLSKINGPYAFGFAGQDSAGDREALAGSFGTDGTGTIASGVADEDIAGTVTNPSLTGAYTAPSSTTGRMAIHLSPSGGSNLNLSAYVVSATELLAIETDAFSTDGIASGEILAQNSASFTNASFNSASVYYETGAIGGASPAGQVEIGLLSPDGNGNLSATYDSQTGFSFGKDQTFAATYAVSANGRASIAGWYGDTTNPPRILYLVDANKGFFLNTDANAGLGFVEGQSGVPAGGFTNASFATAISVATVTPSLAGTLNGVGLATPDGSGGFSEAVNLSNANGLFVSQTTTGQYSIVANGRGMITGLSISTELVSASMFALAAGLIFVGLRKPRRRAARSGLALFSFAVLLAATPAGCPICPDCKPGTNELVLYMISPEKAVMIHQASGNGLPEVTIVEE
ncbi:MAG TPA: Ig domain-containing protein [Candidatus Limnocylindrales bacterium]|nr:Ig domain-containing protein [Candidatus Limnocylindrales bacterium]